MTKKPTKQLPSTGTRWAIGVFLVVAFGLIVLLFMWILAPPATKRSEPEKTYPLSGEFEYIGKEAPNYILPFSKSGADGTYYYGTDLSLEEIKQRVGRNLTVIELSPTDVGGLYMYKTMAFSSNDNKTLFTVNYTDERDGIIKAWNLSSTKKKAVMYISDKYYAAVKQQLGN